MEDRAAGSLTSKAVIGFIKRCIPSWMVFDCTKMASPREYGGAVILRKILYAFLFINGSTCELSGLRFSEHVCEDLQDFCDTSPITDGMDNE